jgi:hypothetical protein
MRSTLSLAGLHPDESDIENQRFTDSVAVSQDQAMKLGYLTIPYRLL